MKVNSVLEKKVKNDSSNLFRTNFRGNMISADVFVKEKPSPWIRFLDIKKALIK